MDEVPGAYFLAFLAAVFFLGDFLAAFLGAVFFSAGGAAAGAAAGALAAGAVFFTAVAFLAGDFLAFLGGMPPKPILSGVCWTIFPPLYINMM